MFPGSIAAINGAGFTPDPSRSQGEYLFFHQQGAPFFSIVPISGAGCERVSRNLNVIYGGKGYVLMPRMVEDPLRAWATLTLKEAPSGPPPAPPRGHAVPVVKVDDEAPQQEAQAPGTARLLGMLDTVRMFSTFDIPTIEDAIDIMPHITLSLREDDWHDYGGYAVRTDMVLRNEDSDLLGFSVEVVNRADNPVHFEPDAVAIRAGEHIYPAVIADMQWSVGAGGSQRGYFVVGAGAEGAPNLLDVSNPFKIILTPVAVQ
jgi:hypothetical protein